MISSSIFENSIKEKYLKLKKMKNKSRKQRKETVEEEVRALIMMKSISKKKIFLLEKLKSSLLT